MSGEEMHPDAIDAVAAEEYDGDDACTYEDCDNEADWTVEVTAGGPGILMNVCQSCSNSNLLYAKENELYLSDISEEAEYV